MDPNFTKLQNRTIQYWFVDGLAECAAGLLGLFAGILFWVWPFFWMWRWSLMVILGAGLAMSFGLRLVIQRIKERSTYPRTGYAAPNDCLNKKRSLLITIVFVLILIGSNVYLTTKAPQNWLWSSGMAGLGAAMVFIWIGALTKQRRLYLLAILSACVGIAMAILGVDFFQGAGILFGGIGLILLFQGYRTHMMYIKQNPLPNGQIDE